MRSKFNQSASNLSRDSGVLMPKPANGHSRSASNTSSAQFDLIHDDPDETRFKINRKSILIVLGLIFTVFACLSFVYFPLLLKRVIQSIINIKPGGEFYDFWLQSSQPTEVGIYFFHVENPWAVENGLEKLRLREMGKYMFKQRFNREISNFTEDMSIVNFNELRYFMFDEEKTTGSLDDNITVVNVPYAALSTLIPRYVDNLPVFPLFSIMDQLSYRPINSFLESHNQHLFINTTVRELLYGYRLDILDTANSYGNWLSKFGIDVSSPKLFPNNSFGILNGRNGTPDGPYEMYTGLGGTRDKFGYFRTWDGKTKLDIWKSDTCNAIRGTDGTIWPAGVNKKDRLYFFIPDICRSLYVTFQEESQFKGIPTYIFSTPDSVLAGKRSNPENECFCTEMDDDLAEQRCTLDGIFDFSACQNGIPLIVSLPHFLNADKRITDDIEGLKPDAVRHRPVLHIEPTMGTVIHGDSRLQMSIRVPPNENLRGFDRLGKDLYIPIFWGYKKLGMSNEMAKELKMRLFTPVKIINLIIICVLFAGISCVFIGFLLTIVSYKQRVLMQIFKVESGLPSESYKPIKHVDDDIDELRRVIVRVESETSDLGDSKSDENSLVNTPRSSTIELERLVKSTETDI